MVQAAAATEAPGAARFWGRVNWPTIVVGVILAGLGALALQLADVREEVARNTESIENIERRLDSMDARLNAMDARLNAMQESLAEMQATLARLEERSGGNPTTAQIQ